MANIVCLLAARAAGAGWDVRARGLARRTGGRSSPTRRPRRTPGFRRRPTSRGLGTDAIRWIPTDGHLRMDVAALTAADRSRRRRRRRAVPGGRHGRVGQHRRGRSAAGDRGAVPRARHLVSRGRRLRRVRRGRAGGARRATRLAPRRLGRGRSAQVAVRAARGRLRAGARSRSGCARPSPITRRTITSTSTATNYVDFGPQNSRGFRALKVWLALRQAGAAGYRQMIADDIRLSRRMADAVARAAASSSS